MKSKYLAAVLFASAQIVASAAQPETNTEARNYEIALTEANSSIALLKIATSANKDGVATNVNTIEYARACNPNAKGKVETGYKFTVSPEATDSVAFEWSFNHLDSMDKVTVDSCILEMPKVSSVAGKRILNLAVGESTVFNDGKYFLSVKRTN